MPTPVASLPVPWPPHEGAVPRSAALGGGAARVVFLAAAVAWVYAPSLNNPLVFDDAWVLHAPHLAEPLRLGEVLSGPRPLVDLSHALNLVTTGWWVPGLRLTNLALHAAAALVLMDLAARLARRALGGRVSAETAAWLGWGTALAWAVHPLASEAVLLTHQRSETLSTLAMFGVLNCWARGLQSRHRTGWLAASAGCAALGALAKETLAMAPLVVWAWDRALGSEGWRQWIRRSGGYYAALILAGLIPAAQIAARLESYQRAGLATTSRASVLEYAWNQPAVLWHYLRLTLWPAPLCLDYDWPVEPFTGRTVLAAGGIVLIVLAIGWGLARRSAWGALGATGLLWLAPTSSVVPIRDLCVEHRMYLPLAAACAAAVLGGWRVVHEASRRAGAGRAPRLLAGLAAAGLVFGAALVARQRVELFGDPVALWTQTLAVAPHNPRARDNLGASLLGAGRPAEAEPHFRAALEGWARRGIFPSNLATNYGLCLNRLGRGGEAIAFYRGVLAERPGIVEIRNNLGALLMERGETAEAERLFAESVRDHPRHVESRYNWALALARQGDLAGARRELQQALELAAGSAAEPARRRIRGALAALGPAETDGPRGPNPESGPLTTER